MIIPQSRMMSSLFLYLGCKNSCGLYIHALINWGLKTTERNGKVSWNKDEDVDPEHQHLMQYTLDFCALFLNPYAVGIRVGVKKISDLSSLNRRPFWVQDTEQQWEESHQVRRLMCIMHCTPPAQTDNTPAPQALKQLVFSCVAHPSTPTEKGHSLLRDGERRGESERCSQCHAGYAIT